MCCSYIFESVFPYKIFFCKCWFEINTHIRFHIRYHQIVHYVVGWAPHHIFMHLTFLHLYKLKPRHNNSPNVLNMLFSLYIRNWQLIFLHLTLLCVLGRFKSKSEKQYIILVVFLDNLSCETYHNVWVGLYTLINLLITEWYIFRN